jgi:diketogulonate reductase-like aldo/keto reductase
MKNIRLANGNVIPAIGLGTFRIEEKAAALNTVSAALKLGYRHIDTAAIYGNEEGVGRGIIDSGVSRSDIFLTTKIWNVDLRAGRIKEACAESLTRLSTDYIDLLLVHWPTGDYVEYWKSFEELYKDGTIKNIGVSNFTIPMLRQLLAVTTIKPVMNQVELHPFLTQKPLLEFCNNEGITLTAWSGFMVGAILTNPEILVIAKKYKKTAAQIIQRWNYQNNIVTIPKSTNIDRMKENIDIFGFEIEIDDLKKVDSLNKNLHKGPDPDTFDF